MPLDYFPSTPLIAICWLCAGETRYTLTLAFHLDYCWHPQAIQPPSRPTVMDFRAAQGNPPPPLLERLWSTNILSWLYSGSPRNFEKSTKALEFVYCVSKGLVN